MTSSEAKRDYAARLTAANIPFSKLAAKTVSFEGFGYGRTVFVEVHGATFPKGKNSKSYMDGVPKPSEGGYVATEGKGCIWA